MKSAKVRFFRASSAACRDCVAAGFDDEALVWEGSVYVEEMGYAKFALGFDMTVSSSVSILSKQSFRSFSEFGRYIYLGPFNEFQIFNVCS